MEATTLPGLRGRILLRSGRMLSALDDEALVEQIRSGNELAFEALYDRYSRGILSFCRHLLGSQEEAEDALQHTFAAAHRELVAGDRELHVKAWLYTIARNRSLSMLRARREQASDEIEIVSTAGLSDEVERRADLKAIVADLQELPEDQRAALVLSEVGDLSHAEIAAVVGCDVSKVKSLVFQARSGLIERRQARETSCEEIQEQLAVLKGGSLRRGPLRRHVADCPACQNYRNEVKRQRALLAIALPAIPSLGLKESALAAAGIGGSAAGGAAVAGSGAAGTGLLGGVAAKAGFAKLVVAAAAGTAAVGGGVAVVATDGGDPPGPDRPGVTSPAGAAGSGGPAGAGVPGAHGDAADRRAREADGRSDEDGSRGERRRGIDPETGEHRGDRGRSNARTRGKGKKNGLNGTQPRRRGPAQQPKVRRRQNQGGGGVAPQRGRSEQAPGSTRRPESPGTQGRGTPAPPPAPAPAPTPQAPVAPQPEVESRGGSGGRGGPKGEGSSVLLP